MKKLLATTVFATLLVVGPMQQAGVLPVSALGNASLAAVAMTLDLVVADAAACPPSGGHGNKSKGGGNNPGKGSGRR